MKKLFLSMVVIGGCCFLSAVPAQAIVAPARTVIPFSGEVDLKAQSARVLFGRSQGSRSFGLEVAAAGSGVYHMKMDIVHVPLPVMDVAAMVEGDIQVTGSSPEAREVSGELRSSYTLLDYLPFHDARLKFAVRGGRFEFDPLWLGGLTVRGGVQLAGKRDIDLTIDLLSADIEDVSAMLKAVVGDRILRSFSVTGVMKGSLTLRGVWPRPNVQALITAYNGQVNKFEYDMISLDMEGAYPFFKVNDAMVTKEEGLSFRVSGALDLSDPSGVAEQVKNFNRSPVVTGDENRREWVFKRLQTGDDTKTEMKYFYLKDDRGDTEAVLGVQKNIGF